MATVFHIQSVWQRYFIFKVSFRVVSVKSPVPLLPRLLYIRSTVSASVIIEPNPVLLLLRLPHISYLPCLLVSSSFRIPFHHCDVYGIAIMSSSLSCHPTLHHVCFTLQHSTMSQMACGNTFLANRTRWIGTRAPNKKFFFFFFLTYSKIHTFRYNWDINSSYTSGWFSCLKPSWQKHALWRLWHRRTLTRESKTSSAVSNRPDRNTLYGVCDTVNQGE